MDEREETPEIWELITPDSWVQKRIATTVDGKSVSPYTPDAVKFSLMGGLIHCYLPRGQIWSPRFEKKRSLLLAALLSHRELKHITINILRYNTTRKISIQRLNDGVDISFIVKLLARMKEMQKGEA